MSSGKEVVQKTPLPEIGLHDLKALLGFLLPEVQRTKGGVLRHFVHDNLPSGNAKIEGGQDMEVWIERRDYDAKTEEEKLRKRLLVVKGVHKTGLGGVRRVTVTELSSEDPKLIENAWQKLFQRSSRA